MGYIGDSNPNLTSTEVDLISALNSLAVSGANEGIYKASATTFGNRNFSSSGGTWGSITGTLANQTDLQSALDAKLDDSQATTFGLSLLDDANAAAGRTTLGLGTAAVVATDLADLNEATIEAAIDTLANLTSAASLATVGTISTGVWQGTTIKANYLQQAPADLGDADITVDLSNSNAGNVTNLIIDGALTIASFAANWTNAGRTVADLGTITTADINGGTIDGVTIGGSSAGAITGTTITANTSVLPDTNDGASLGDSDQGWSDLYLATGGNVLVNNANAFRTLILTAAGGAPTTTAGCSATTKVEYGTNDIDTWVLDFDTTTEEHAFWNVQMPDNYDGGTVTAKFIWTNAAGLTTETVTWGIKAIAYADSGALDQAYGSEITVADTWLAQNDVHISAATSAITIAGSPAGGQYVVFCVSRKTASDNLTGDARLMAVQIEYGINAYSD